MQREIFRFPSIRAPILPGGMSGADRCRAFLSSELAQLLSDCSYLFAWLKILCSCDRPDHQPWLASPGGPAASRAVRTFCEEADVVYFSLFSIKNYFLCFCTGVLPLQCYSLVLLFHSRNRTMNRPWSCDLKRDLTQIWTVRLRGDKKHVTMCFKRVGNLLNFSKWSYSNI